MRHWMKATVLAALIVAATLSWAQRTPKTEAAASAQSQATDQAAGPAAGQGQFVGSDTCVTCHDAEGKGFSTNPHTRLALEHGRAGATCESCHGPGKAHVDGGGDPTKIFNFTKASAKEADEKCLGCHSGQHVNFERSAHAESGVSCVSCHSIHNSADKAQLLKTSQPTLCFQCHSEQKAQFNMPFHHKVDEGLMKCSDCHDPHGTFERKQLRATAEQNAICTRCHTETAGPFVYEHPVVRTEGCVSCHSPHGSPNARLLNISNINSLCLQCHTDINNVAAQGARGAVSPTGPAHSQISTEVACTNCHTQIHGSNASDVYFK